MSHLTLLESGTTRAHFAIVKRIESAISAHEEQNIIQETFDEARTKLAKDPCATGVLLPLLHCLDHYPHLDVSFALLPTLQLVSLATKWSDLLIGHSLLRHLVPSPGDAQSLLLNTFRKQLIEADGLRISAPLKSVAAGVPSGAAVLYSLATPLLKLTSHPRSHVRKEALNAMSKCSQYEDEEGEMIVTTVNVVRELVTRESNPSVLRAAVRAVDLARGMGAIEKEEAVSLIIKVLQAVDWAPSPRRPKLSADYNYHGLSTPWTVIACLDSLAALQPPSSQELQQTILRIYLRASKGVDAALAICISAAKCLGLLYAPTSQGETVAFWTALSQHVKAQLHSSNANRKVAAVQLLSALLPVGWAEGTTFSLSEKEMATLMSLLGDKDDTVRRTTMRLLHYIDASLIEMHIEQLEKDPKMARRTVEAAYLRDMLTQKDEYADTVVRLLSTSPKEQVAEQVLRDYRGLPPAAQQALPRQLLEQATGSVVLYRLVSTLVCEIDVSPEVGMAGKLVDAIVKTQDQQTRDFLLAAVSRCSDREGVAATLAKVTEATSSTLFNARVQRLEDGAVSPASGVDTILASLLVPLPAPNQEEQVQVLFDATDDPFAISSPSDPTYLDLLHACHNHDPWADSTLMPFILDSVQIGFLRPSVVAAIEASITSVPVLRFVTYRGKRAVTFLPSLNDHATRTAGIGRVASRWRDENLFPDPLLGWRNELYSIYGPSIDSCSSNPAAFACERAACALFGFATFGVHLTAYTSSYGIWVPRRSATKSTWPGYLDNSVAGGITAGDLPTPSMIRECEEEASLPPSIVTPLLKPTGVLSYFYKTQRNEWVQPEVEYIYDLPLPDEIILTPQDGEAESFTKMTVQEVKQRIKKGEFKANCVLVLLDFMIRHGLIGPEEPGYNEVVRQLHTDIKLPGP